jgi:transketolase
LRTLAVHDTAALAAQLRRHVVEMTSAGKSSHVGSGLGCADVVAVLYGEVLALHDDPADPRRDRFVMSKGHAGAVIYAALAEVGYLDVAQLLSHCGDGSILSGHVSYDVPGVEVSTGALGHGLGIAVGMAMAAQFRQEEQRYYALLSEGDCDEGSTWEAVMFAAHRGLHRLTAVVDYNKLQSLASVQDTVALEPFTDKWRAFGWDVVEVDGHDHRALADALSALSDKPRCVIAHTTKGKGVSFMENSVLWHYRTPQGDELEAARSELGAR